MASKVSEMYTNVWSMRQFLDDVWPTPDMWTSLRFAVTEAAEALDAELRTDARWARNNDKNLDVIDELADCTLMLLTSLGARWHDNWERHDQDIPVPLSYNGIHLDGIVGDVARLNSEFFEWQNDLGAPDLTGYTIGIIVAIRMYCAHRGVHLEEVLDQRLERIKAKRIGDLTRALS